MATQTSGLRLVAGTAIAIGAITAAYCAFLTPQNSTLNSDQRKEGANGRGKDTKEAPIAWTQVPESDISLDAPFAIPISPSASPLKTASPPTISVKAGTDPYRPRMSLSRLEPNEFIVIDAATVPQLLEKQILLSNPEMRAKCIAWTEGRDPAARELLDCTARFLATRYPSLFRFEPGRLEFTPGLKDGLKPHKWEWDPRTVSSERCMEILSGCAPDDFVVLEKRGHLKEVGFQPAEQDKKLFEGDDDEYLVTSSTNCFSFPGPLLKAALNSSLKAIHGNVPHAPAIMPYMEKFFKTLKTEGPQKRWNCTFVDFGNYHRELRNEANQGISEVVAIDQVNAGERVWVRCERQTFIRLPVTRAVVFGIRTYVHPLGELIDQEGKEMAERLLRHIKSFDEPTKEYRRMSKWIPPVIVWLENKVASM